MLAQQSGSATYDSKSHHPLLATATSFLLLGALLTGLRQPMPEPPRGPVPVNSLSRLEEGQQLGTMHGLGRTLFGDYLFAVELAGTLLLIASIGAIAVAPRREQGSL
jgi:NADH-quinone oxidoreductase subunit J